MANRNTKRNAKRAAKAAKKHPILFNAVIILLVLVIIAAAVLYVLKPELYHIYLRIGEHSWGEEEVLKEATCGTKGKVMHACLWCGEEEEYEVPATGNHDLNDDGICTVCGFDSNFYGTKEDVAEAEFSIHVIDLGKNAGDSIYIKAGDKDILIDAGATGSSATLICNYLANYVTDGKLEYVIATHGDQDHIAAFYGNKSGSTRTGVLYQYEVDTLIKFSKTTKTTTIYNNFMSRVSELEENGTKVYTAGECYNEENGAKRQYWLDSEHTLSMNILYNRYYYEVSGDENNHSVVTLFTKNTDAGKVNYLFTGDLEKDGESEMVDYYSNPAKSKSEYDVLPEVEFYKAGHHGSGTSSTEKLLNVIQPKYVAISCCAGSPEYTKNNSNTFPYQASLDNILKHTDKIYCTGQAINLPELKDGKFANQTYDYEPLNGNIVFFFNTRVAESGATSVTTKLWCSNSFITITETDWFKNYRTRAA